MNKPRAIIGYVISDGTWNNTTKSFFVEADSMNFTVEEAVDMFLIENKDVKRDEVCVNPILDPVGDIKNPPTT